MHPIFDRSLVTQVIDEYYWPWLPDALNASLALFKPRRIPREVNVNEGAKTLQVKSLGSSIGPDENTQFTSLHTLLQHIPANVCRIPP